MGTSTGNEAPWEPLGAAAAPDALVEARLQLHWAAHAVAAVGETLLDRRPDDSHASFEWHEGTRALVSGATGAGLRAGLRLADLTLVVLGDGGAAVRAALPLDGKTLAGALDWLGASLARLGEARAAQAPLRPPGHDLPAHAVGGGAPFGGAAPTHLAELARWYGAADGWLRGFARATPGASTVRCWPHHFDLATLVTLSAGKTIGVGLSPGDGSYAEPYWYVTPSPYSAGAARAALDGEGTWHRAGWFGAVLTGTRLAAAGVAAEPQRARLEAFARSALAACRALVG
ncbi:MAG TPA: hypothetical protein VG389_27230 [Myxococcota bacterium]|jgi:hypothetical protein|nr:hypothetical protein [Myxococcota bacterium]